MPQENKELNNKGVVGKLWGIKTLNDLDIKLFEFLDKLTINEKQYGALSEEYALKLSDFIQSLLDKQLNEVIKLIEGKKLLEVAFDSTSLMWKQRINRRLDELLTEIKKG